MLSIEESSISWELSEVKELHPLGIAEYNASMGIDHKPGFNSWILHTMKKCDVIIILVKKSNTQLYLKYTHKFGIKCPKTVEDALELNFRMTILCGQMLLPRRLRMSELNLMSLSIVPSNLSDTSSLRIM